MNDKNTESVVILLKSTQLIVQKVLCNGEIIRDRLVGLPATTKMNFLRRIIALLFINNCTTTIVGA